MEREPDIELVTNDPNFDRETFQKEMKDFWSAEIQPWLDEMVKTIPEAANIGPLDITFD